MSKIVDGRQLAFLEERNILDKVLVKNMIVHEVMTKKRAYLIFKADFENAYDTMRWSFLAYMLHRMGFCNKWIGYINVELPSIVFYFRSCEW